jgi:putative transposase
MRPHRLRGFEYFGYYHYSLTMCTFRRQPFFDEPSAVALVCGIFFEAADACGMVIPAYCFMPDHVHLVVSGRQDNADLVRFARRSRQRSGFALRRKTCGPLWQDGYYEHILRDHEPLARTIRYIGQNPVRAGLVDDWEKYAFTGSQLGPLFHVLEWLDERSGHDEDALLGLTEGGETGKGIPQ